MVGADCAYLFIFLGKKQYVRNKDKPTGGGPRSFHSRDLVLHCGLGVKLDVLKTFCEITIKLAYLQVALYCRLGYFMGSS